MGWVKGNRLILFHLFHLDAQILRMPADDPVQKQPEGHSSAETDHCGNEAPLQDRGKWEMLPHQPDNDRHDEPGKGHRSGNRAGK